MKYKMGFNNILPFVLESNYSDEKWGSLNLMKQKDELDIRSQHLHYGQSIFEGIKIYISKSEWKIFRIEDHLERFNKSALRLDMPTIDIKSFIRDLVKQLKLIKKELNQDIDYIYIRPIMYSTTKSIKVASGKDFTLKIVFSLLKEMEYPELKVWVETKQPRSFSGGTGNVKFSGNYAPTFNIQKKATENNCDTVLWLGDTFLEELTSMNIFFYDKEHGWITPKINNRFLDGITRRSFISCFDAKEEKLQWLYISNRIKEQKITKAIGTGTAIGIRTIESFNDDGLIINFKNKITKKELEKYQEYILGIKNFWLVF